MKLHRKQDEVSAPNAHLSNDQLLDQMYGLGENEAHLEACAECRSRFEAMTRTKAQASDNAASQPAEAFFSAQRRTIYARLDSAVASHFRWVPALAGAGLVAMGLLLAPHAPAPTPLQPAPAAMGTQLTSNETVDSNQQLFSDLYSMEQSLEPSAAAPIHELFEQGDGSGQ